jgi:hypothetical protein
MFKPQGRGRQAARYRNRLALKRHDALRCRTGLTGTLTSRLTGRPTRAPPLAGTPFDRRSHLVLDVPFLLTAFLFRVALVLPVTGRRYGAILRAA